MEVRELLLRSCLQLRLPGDSCHYQQSLQSILPPKQYVSVQPEEIMRWVEFAPPPLSAHLSPTMRVLDLSSWVLQEN